MNGTSHAFATSLLAARMGQGAKTPLTEHQFVDRLHIAARAIGCRSDDLVTAIYIGLKLHMTICVHGPSRERTAQLFDTLAASIVGAQSGQTLHLRGPVGNDAMAQRFTALRLGEFITAAADVLNQDKVWFLIVDTAGDPAPMLQWVEHEIQATRRANGWRQRQPDNVFVLVSSGEPPTQRHPRRLLLAAPFWGDVPAQPAAATLPPVGYQRYLLDHLLTGGVYRERLRALDHSTSGRARLARRWLAASVDDRWQGLWDRTNIGANTHKALAALRVWGREAGT